MTPPGGYEIRITPWAAQQLKEEIAWSRRRWGRQHQLAYRRALLERLGRIAGGPHGSPGDILSAVRERFRSNGED